MCVTFLAGSVNGSVNDIDKYDCFISHSSEDMTNAMSLVERLESRRVNCWVAPRNIDAGANYSDEIVEGIRTSASLIVLISKDSLNSRHVQREVNLADDLRKPIYPVKLIDIEIYGGLSFYLSASQEVRLFEKTGDPVEKLISSIKAISGSPAQGQPEVGTDPAVPVDQIASGSQQANKISVAAGKLDRSDTQDSQEYGKENNQSELIEPNKKLLWIASVLVLSLVAVSYILSTVDLDAKVASGTSSENYDPVDSRGESALEFSDSPTSHGLAKTDALNTERNTWDSLRKQPRQVESNVLSEESDTSPEDVRIKELQNSIDELLVRFTERHPRVVIMRQAIADLERSKKLSSTSSLSDETDTNAPLAKIDKLTTLEEPLVFVEPEMIVISAGEFLMGSESGYPDEQPVRKVTIAAFELARHELTWGEWEQCESAGVCPVLARPYWINEMEAAERTQHPVVNVRWDEAQIYIGWINTVTDGGYRLPSEAEFEYALRADTEEEYPWEEAEQCDHSNGLDQAYQRKYPDNTEGADCDDGFIYTAPVGSFRVNAFELYDVSGNAWEWTQDCLNHNYDEAPSDGSAWETGECGSRRVRGGGWGGIPVNFRSADRNGSDRGSGSFYVGFRLARTP